MFFEAHKRVAMRVRTTMADCLLRSDLSRISRLIALPVRRDGNHPKAADIKAERRICEISLPIFINNAIHAVQSLLLSDCAKSADMMLSALHDASALYAVGGPVDT
jgi:hypothetical protein